MFFTISLMEKRLAHILRQNKMGLGNRLAIAKPFFDVTKELDEGKCKDTGSKIPDAV